MLLLRCKVFILSDICRVILLLGILKPRVKGGKNVEKTKKRS